MVSIIDLSAFRDEKKIKLERGSQNYSRDKSNLFQPFDFNVMMEDIIKCGDYSDKKAVLEEIKKIRKIHSGLEK